MFHQINWSRCCSWWEQGTPNWQQTQLHSDVISWNWLQYLLYAIDKVSSALKKVKALTILLLCSMLSIDLTDIPWTAQRACYSPCWAIKLIGYWTSSCFPSFSLLFSPTCSNSPHSSGKALRAQCYESLMKLSLFHMHLLCWCCSNSEVLLLLEWVDAIWKVWMWLSSVCQYIRQHVPVFEIHQCTMKKCESLLAQVDLLM